MAQMPTAQEVAQNWRSGVANSSAKMQRGVERVQTSPTEKAASEEAQVKYRNGTQEASSSGRMSARLRSVSLSDWKSAMLNKGVPRASQGASASVEKFQRAIAPVLAYEASLVDQVRAMPSSTPEEREQRMLAWARGMRQYKTNRSA